MPQGLWPVLGLVSPWASGSPLGDSDHHPARGVALRILCEIRPLLSADPPLPLLPPLVREAGCLLSS